jgi:hypothetical protein
MVPEAVEAMSLVRFVPAVMVQAVLLVAAFAGAPLIVLTLALVWPGIWHQSSSASR